MLIAVILTILGFIAAHYAQARGRNPIAWFVICLCFGLFGLLALFLLPSLKEHNTLMAPVEKEKKQVIPESFSQVEWFYLDGSGKQKGPLSFYAMQEAWQKRELSTDHYVWNPHMKDWQRVKDIQNLSNFLI